MTKDRVFLDANVLFSAAWSEASRLRLLWELKGGDLLTSGYALEEARRSLDEADARARLDFLAARIHVVPEQPEEVLPGALTLREKDRPILAAAIGAGATHLVTGDRRDFGPFFGKRIAGVLVLSPAEYLDSARDRATGRVR